MPRQILTIQLDGLTAGDYLAHLRDPEPAALGHALRSIVLRAEPLGDVVQATLEWDGAAPAPRAAARAAGLPVVAEVARADAVVVHELAAERAVRSLAPIAV